MTGAEYFRLIERIAEAGDAATVAELLRANPFREEWQLRDALSLCDTPAEAHAVLSCNDGLAQLVASQAAMMADLNARDPVADTLVAAVRAATSPETVAALFAEASPSVYANAAGQLTLSRYSADEMGRRYHELVLGESRT